jgi:hypothetical protein
MNQSKSGMRWLAAWAGMLGPLLFVIIFTVNGLLRPGYRALSTYISDLSIGPQGWIQIVNFLIFGVLLFIFALGVAAEFPTGKASKGGVILLYILAACYFLSGPFVTDPIGTSQSQATIHGTIHGIFGAIVFLLMPITIFVFLRRFRIDPNWQSLRWWTLGLGIITAVGLVLFTIISKAPSFQNTFTPWFGLLQRSEIIPFMVWIFVFALGLYQRNKKS